jgi:hypothetical protein
MAAEIEQLILTNLEAMTEEEAQRALSGTTHHAA